MEAEEKARSCSKARAETEKKLQNHIQASTEIEEKLKQGKVSPAYLVYGSEDYLIDGLIEAISNKFLGSIEKEIWRIIGGKLII